MPGIEIMGCFGGGGFKITLPRSQRSCRQAFHISARKITGKTLDEVKPSAHLRSMKRVNVLFTAACWLGAGYLWAAPTEQAADPDPMSGLPSREELRKRRARATNAPIAFTINSVTQKMEARNIDGSIVEEYPTGTVGRVLDAGGYELRVSFGRDEKRRLSLMVRPGPAQLQPVQISVFDRRLILPPGTSVSAAMEKEGEVVTIEPCLTGIIYYLDTEPTPVEVSPDKVRLVASKNLVRIGRDVRQGRLPDEEMIDAVVQGTLETEEKQTPQNNAGMAVGSWLQNATTSLMGLPNPQAAPPATVVKVSAGTPELSAPANAAVTPNTDTKPVVTDRNVATTPVTQNVKVIALRAEAGGAVAPQKPFFYEEGSRQDLVKASREGMKPRPLEDPTLVPPAPAQALNRKPPGDAAGNAVWKAVRSFFGMPEATTVQREAEKLAHEKPGF